MKFLVVLAGCALYCASALRLKPEEQHEGLFEAWNDFWSSFGKDQSSTASSTNKDQPKAEQKPATTQQDATQANNQPKSENAPKEAVTTTSS